MSNESPISKHVSEHLANERTYLAWLRTSFGILTLGFATNKFSQFLNQLHAESGQDLPHGLFPGSRRFGLGMVIFATVLMVFAIWNYHTTKQQIDSNSYQSKWIMILIVSFFSISFGITAVSLLFQS